MFKVLLVGTFLIAHLRAFPASVTVDRASTTWFSARGDVLGTHPSRPAEPLPGARIVCTNAGPAVCASYPQRDQIRSHIYYNWPTCVRWNCAIDPPVPGVEAFAAEMRRDQGFHPENFHITIIKQS